MQQGSINGIPFHLLCAWLKVSSPQPASNKVLQSLSSFGDPIDQLVLRLDIFA